MNGPLKVFRTTQFVKHDVEVSLPDCMYKLKNIHKERNGMVAERSADHVSSTEKKLDIFDQVKQFLKNNQEIPGMALLEARQQRILAQLAELKKQMLTLKSSLTVNSDGQTLTTVTLPSTSSSSACCRSEPIQINGLSEIVINCSPQYPPYSIAIIQKLWQNKLNLTVKTYTHSTINSIPPEVQTFASVLENFKSNCTSPRLNLRIIWKDVGPQTQIIISRLPIIGEINLLRYLARISTDELNYEQFPNPHEIDALLDMCYRIITSKTKTERASLLHNIYKSLGKSQWLAGRMVISVADIAVYSILKQIDKSEVNATLGKLVERIESLT